MNWFLEPALSFLELGGPVVVILTGLSVIALAIIGLKLFGFMSLRVGMHSEVKSALELWQENNQIGALRSLRGSKSPVGKCLAVAMQRISSGQEFKEDIEDAVQTTAVKELHELQRGFRALEAIAQISPLLGLFGTVLGMIDAFQKLQSAGNSVDPSILAGGIWVALLTTAAGLAVAMPVSLVLTWFETRVDDERITIQTMVNSLINTNTDFAAPNMEDGKPVAAVAAHAN
ncbi:MAG: MotA/TolQ/ExbB proton channel family protein [Pseudomonadota bacterium]